MQKSPLSDLSFFKFPEVTPEIVQGIVLLFFVIALTIAATLYFQNLANRMHERSRHRRTVSRVSRSGNITPAQKALMDHILAMTGHRKLHELLKDAQAFEGAVAALVEQGDRAQLADLAELRQVFHLNVMNPAQELVSTRQLLADFPLRLVATYKEERLDLYCGILERDERFLVLDLNAPEEVVRMLQEQPECDLIFWRENEGETLFHVQLEQIPSAREMPVFRAIHAFRVEGVAQRADFRLTVEMPLHYTYMAQEALRRAQPDAKKGAGALSGEGRLVDLSFGGASFAAERALDPKGIVQLQFDVHGKPVRLMLEVISSEPYGGHESLIRGRLRGMQSEGRALLNDYLSREQIKRLREREAFHVRPGA